MAAGKIFVCYRREDSAGHAGRLYDRLNQRFPGRIFMDVAGIGVGTRWAEVIEQTLGSCEVAVILIGRRWLERSAAGTRRIDDPEDSLRAEITTALRLKLKIVPLLVAGAAVPEADDLPPDVAPIVDWQALRIDDEDFDHDSSRLIKALERQLGVQGDPRPKPAQTYTSEQPRPLPPQRRAGRWVIFGILGIVGGIAALVIPLLVMQANREPDDIDTFPVTSDFYVETPAPGPQAPQMAGDYDLTSYTVQGTVLPLSGGMRLTPIGDGRFQFDMRVTNHALGRTFQYHGLLENQGAYWTTTTLQTDDETTAQGPIQVQVSFDGATLKTENSFGQRAVWQKQ
jgi:hypothetical protein